MSATYRRVLDHLRGIVLLVEFTTVQRAVADYSVVLMMEQGDATETVRLYDGAHAVNEIHRHTRGGVKQPAEVFHRGTLAEGMRAAIADIYANYEAMIDAWERE